LAAMLSSDVKCNTPRRSRDLFTEPGAPVDNANKSWIAQLFLPQRHDAIFESYHRKAALKRKRGLVD
jgi:hypothetical protein